MPKGILCVAPPASVFCDTIYLECKIIIPWRTLLFFASVFPPKWIWHHYHGNTDSKPTVSPTVNYKIKWFSSQISALAKNWFRSLKMHRIGFSFFFFSLCFSSLHKALKENYSHIIPCEKKLVPFGDVCRTKRKCKKNLRNDNFFSLNGIISMA